MAISKPISELNGKWSILFRINLVILPVFLLALIGWGTWVTRSIYGIEKSLAVDEYKIKSHLMDHVKGAIK
jgi:hypothetical protein